MAGIAIAAMITKNFANLSFATLISLARSINPSAGLAFAPFTPRIIVEAVIVPSLIAR